MKEPLVITHRQNKTTTPDGWQRGWGCGACGWEVVGGGGGGTEGKRVRVREGGIEGQEGRDCRIHRRQEGYTVERGVSTLL